MTASLRSAPFFIAASLLVACAHPAPKPPAANATVAAPVPASAAARDWLEDVDAIAAAADNAGRRAEIAQRLALLDVEVRTVAFQSDHGPGENLLADIAGNADAPLLLLGAHSDRVGMGTGATDNASGSAVVLELAERFQAEPLQHHRVAVAFWDQEELGLLGAHAFVQSGGQQPAQYVNFDVFGWGDTVWMMAPDPTHALVASTQATAADAGLKLSAGTQYPPTDHRAFLDAQWPAVSYSLVGGDEIDGILGAYAGKPPATMPKVMQVLHSEHDTMSQIDPNAAVRGIDAIESALRQWDAAAGGAGTAAGSH